MFIVAVFRITQTQKQLRCPSAGEGVNSGPAVQWVSIQQLQETNCWSLLQHKWTSKATMTTERRRRVHTTSFYSYQIQEQAKLIQGWQRREQFIPWKYGWGGRHGIFQGASKSLYLDLVWECVCKRLLRGTFMTCALHQIKLFLNKKINNLQIKKKKDSHLIPSHLNRAVTRGRKGRADYRHVACGETAPGED